MNALIGGLAALLLTHYLLAHPLRAALVGKLGKTGFSVFFSLVAFACLVPALLGFRSAPAGPALWGSGPILWATCTVLMLIASILFVGSFFGNPAMPRPDADSLAHAPAHGVFGITRHPLMWAIALWSLVHILVSPTERLIILGSAFILLALVGSMGQDHKKAVLMGEGWKGWTSRTSFVPFGGQLSGKKSWASAWPGWTPTFAGLALWLIITWAHPLWNAPPAGIWAERIPGF
jgi:uncharacterized membrane protein